MLSQPSGYLGASVNSTKALTGTADSDLPVVYEDLR